MSEVILIKTEDGRLDGLGEKGGRAWRRFRAWVASMEAGDTLTFAWRKPRSPKHHRLLFAKLAALHDRQEQFDEPDSLRMWLLVGAGFCDFVPGPKGRMVALPKSMRWDRMDENEFCEVHLAVNAFMREPHAYRFLWPHLSDEQGAQMVEQWLGEFER